MPRPIRATISAQALQANYRFAKTKSVGAEVFAVLKANAYGHGVERVGLALRETADAFAVLDLNEAITLRRLGCYQPILMLEGVFSAEDLWVVIQYQLEIVVATPSQLAMIEAVSHHLPTDNPLKCTVKVRSAMNRLGFSVEEASTVWERLVRCPATIPSRWMAHFANADHLPPININRADISDAAKVAIHDTAMDNEMCLTIQAMTTLQNRYPAPLSLANSAAILRFPSSHCQATRLGIMLYGGSPIGEVDGAIFGLKSVMCLSSEVIALQDINTGEAVGYGSRFVAKSKSRIAVVACGYADGYPRHAVDGTPVWIDGKIYPLAGRVSMDMLTVDVSNAQHINIGAPVELWGEHVSADTVAHHASTISYQLFCHLAPRVEVSCIA